VAAHGAGTLIVAAYGDGPQADERLVTLVGADGQEELAVAWTSATHSVRILIRGTPTLPVVVPKDFPVVVCRWQADGRLEVQAPGALHATTVVGNAPGPATVLIIGGGARGTPGFHGDIWSCLWRPTVVADQEMVDLLRTCGWEPPFSNVSPL